MGQYYQVVVDESTVYDRSVDGEYTMAKLMEHSWWRNEFVGSITNLLFESPHKIAWVGDYSDEINEKLHTLAWREENEGGIKGKTIHESIMYLDNKILINHDKKEYIDCGEYYDNCVDKNGWCVHPIPLLTAIGNGLGGGDYRSDIGEEDVGRWANDKIEVVLKSTFDKKDEYSEIEVIFKEV